VSVDKVIATQNKKVCPKRFTLDAHRDTGVISLGYSTLHEAAKDGNSFAIYIFINRGVNVNEKDTSGYTPLYWAIKSGICGSVRKLLTKGANPFVVELEETQSKAIKEMIVTARRIWTYAESGKKRRLRSSCKKFVAGTASPQTFSELEGLAGTFCLQPNLFVRKANAVITSIKSKLSF
jgi:hypothetical protein